MYGAGAWTLREIDRKYLETDETWRWRRMEKSSWTDRVKKKKVKKPKPVSWKTCTCVALESFSITFG